MDIRWVLAVLLVAAPASVNAQTYICPGGPGPGEVQMGVQNDPGFNGVPVCARDIHAQDGEAQSADDIAASYGPGPDPMARRLEAAIAMEKLLLAGKVKEAQLRSDPRYQRYANGGWDYFQDSANARPGALCTALFTKKGSFVALVSPGLKGENAYLTFWGPDVPKPAQARRVRVTLDQTGGEPPQTVTAFNSVNPAAGIGGITLAVPTIDALLDTMLTVHDFKVIMDGKVVAQIGWTGGDVAREQLKACVKG